MPSFALAEVGEHFVPQIDDALVGNLAAAAAPVDNAGIHLLHRRTEIIEHVRFVGCTLWTNYHASRPP
jgi:hypothetical protein